MGRHLFDRALTGWCAVACILGVCWALMGAASASAQPTFSWSGPETIDPGVPGEGFFFLGGISCPSVSLCVAYEGTNGTVGRNGEPIVGGRVFSTTDPSGGANAWHGMNLDPSLSISDLSCPSASLCVAVDSGGNVLTSTAPSGGLTAWQVTPVASDAFAALSCASTSLCVALDRDGHLWTSTDPSGGAAAWHDGGYLVGADQSLYGPSSVACAPAVAGALCVAISSPPGGGKWVVFTSTNPAGGAQTWASGGDLPIGPDTAFGGPETISCPSVAMCVATDLAGDVLVSTTPTAGGGSWRIDHIAEGLQGVSCESETLCFAYQGDQNPSVLVSGGPTGGAATWSSTGASYTTGVSCPSPSLCIAVGENGPNGGSVQVGTPGGAGGQGGGGSGGGSGSGGGAGGGGGGGGGAGGGGKKTRSETVRVAGGTITATVPNACTRARSKLAAALTFTRGRGKHASLVKVYRVDYTLGSGQRSSVRHAPFDALLKMPAGHHHAHVRLTVRTFLVLAHGRRSTKTIRLAVTRC